MPRQMLPGCPGSIAVKAARPRWGISHLRLFSTSRAEAPGAYSCCRQTAPPAHCCRRIPTSKAAGQGRLDRVRATAPPPCASTSITRVPAKGRFTRFASAGNFRLCRLSPHRTPTVSVSRCTFRLFISAPSPWYYDPPRSPVGDSQVRPLPCPFGVRLSPTAFV